MKITIKKLNESELAVNFPYHPVLVEKIKSLPPRSRKWEDRTWKVQIAQLENLYRVFDGHQIEADDEIFEAMAKKWEVREETQKEIEALVNQVPETVNGYKLFNHQREVIPQMLRAQKCILGDDRGLGKSLTAMVASKLLQPRPVHIISPVSVYSVWETTAKECGVVLAGLHSWDKIPKEIPPRTILIADECHRGKGGYNTKRGQGILNIARQAEFLFLLSGTPIKNGRAMELFPLLEACGHPSAQNFFAFRERYCEAQIIRRKGKEPITIYVGMQNEHELRNKVADILFVRKKDQCLDLPPKIFQWRKVENCLTGSEADELQSLMKEFFPESGRKKHDEEEIQESYFEELRRKAKFTVIRRLTSLAKVDGTIELLQDLLDQGESVAVCTAFVEPLERITEHFKDYGVSVIHGGVAPNKRGKTIEDFQSGKNRLFCYTIGAGGEGITIHKAAYLIMHDRTWVPGENDQAIDRLHRIGQNRTVFVTKVSTNRMDWVVDMVARKKSKYIDRVIY